MVKSLTAKIGRIPVEKFLAAIGGPILDIIKQNDESHEVLMQNIDSDSVYWKQHRDIDPAELLFVDEIGSGNFSKVMLVQNADRSQYFAVKVIPRNKIEELSIHRYLIVNTALPPSGQLISSSKRRKSLK